MKWFFALNESALTDKRALWEPMIRVAVASAKARTSLQPHMIVDGPGRDPFLREMAAEGVRIIMHRLTYLDRLTAYFGPGSPGLAVASGAFLRTEIPLLEVEDDLVLYTDCDVMFQHDPAARLADWVPLACAPEFRQDDYDAINTGVIVMNTALLRGSLPYFRAWIESNIGRCLAYDQGAYREFYAGQFGRLSPELNWKPYWGPSDTAPIVHFHGPKPKKVRKLLADPGSVANPTYRELFSWNPDGYAHFMAKWNVWDRPRS